jgi:hypothetical protein
LLRDVICDIIEVEELDARGGHMLRKKAYALVDSIIATHAGAAGVDVRVAQVLRDAGQDIKGLIAELLQDCRDENADVDAEMDEAIEIVRDAA